MNLSRPLKSLIPSLEGDVLTVLTGAEASFTGLQVQKLMNRGSNRGVLDTLQKLCTQGLVTRTPAGSADLYELNREHLLAKCIIDIANIRKEFYENLGEQVNSWVLKPECVAIFGSATRRNMNSESDIDIFVSRARDIAFEDRDWREQLTNFSLKVERWTGNVVQIFEVSYEDMKKELATTEDVIHSIIDEGVVVYGPLDYLRTLRNKMEAQ